MTSYADLVHRIATAIVGFARRPSRLLLIAATVVLAVFTALAVIIFRAADGAGSWLPLVIAAVFAVPVVTLALRRQRLLAAVAGAGRHPVVHEEVRSAEVIVDGAPTGPEERLAGNLGVFAGHFSSGRWHGRGLLPNVSAVQALLLQALGGEINAPYLRDDLGTTFAATLGTLLVIPLASAGSIILATIALLL